MFDIFASSAIPLYSETSIEILEVKQFSENISEGGNFEEKKPVETFTKHTLMGHTKHSVCVNIIDMYCLEKGLNLKQRKPSWN